ncbi:hypothetical protein [Ekhidna sp.]|uniref:hypothetical protein n=1 Tax=Ekhidna sp. TaxID=2608089 RepID=UPI003BAA2B9D
MHTITPYERWNQYYNSSHDEKSPFSGKEYNYDLYSENIYGYYIDPAWDFFGSETLYIKILFADYELGFAVIEMIGEWNDAINNDIMQFKRNILEHMMDFGINKFALVGENIMNFHGSDDCYYEEWFEEVEDGWIAGINFGEFIIDEMKNYNIDNYINMSGSLQIEKWRTVPPLRFYQLVDGLIQRRLAI